MDKFLEIYGMRTPYKVGTTTSANEGVTASISEFKGKYYLNNLWTAYGRLVICNLAAPTVYTGKAGTPDDKNQTPTYGVRVLLNPLGCGDIESACIALAYAAKGPFSSVTYGDKVFSVEQRLFDPTVPAGLQIKVPLLDGNMKYAKDPVNDEIYKGFKYLNARMYPSVKKTGAQQRPVLISASGEVLTDPSFIKNGDYVTVKLSLNTYVYENNPGIRAGFDTVRYAAEGDLIASGFNGEAAARAAASGMEPTDFGSFVTKEAVQPNYNPAQPPPGGIPTHFPPSAAPAATVVVASPPPSIPPPPQPVWNAQTGQWEFPQQQQAPANAAMPAGQPWQAPH